MSFSKFFAVLFAVAATGLFAHAIDPSALHGEIIGCVVFGGICALASGIFIGFSD